MSKRTNLQILNRCLNKINEPEVSSFASCTDGNRAYQAYNNLIEAQRFIYNTNKGKWRWAEALGTGTFVTSAITYTPPTDLNMEDYGSFRIANANCSKAINYLDADKFEDAYPYIDPATEVGWPNYFTKFANLYQFNKYAGTAQNSANYYFRYWKFEAGISTASASSTATASGATPTFTATLLLPEQFEELLTDYAAMLQLDFEGDLQANTYRVKVYGGMLNGKEIRGGINEMKDIWNSTEKFTIPVDIIL